MLIRRLLVGASSAHLRVFRIIGGIVVNGRLLVGASVEVLLLLVHNRLLIEGAASRVRRHMWAL